MDSFSPLIYKLLLALAVLSGVYFSGLVLHLNGGVIVLFSILGMAAVLRLSAFKMAPANFPVAKEFSRQVTIVFCVSLVLLSGATFVFTHKWGSWDAIFIWNLSAQALSNPDHWRRLFQYTTTNHTDYPLFLPSLNALFLRFLPVALWFVVPVFFAALSTILIPLWLFIRLAPKHIGVGVGVLLLFLINTYYLQLGVTQGADVWLSLWVTAAFFAYEDALTNGRSLLYALSGFFAALAACTKNEGILILLCFFLFALTFLPAKKKIFWMLAGALVPCVYLLFFKAFLAPANDLFKNQEHPVLEMLTDVKRYQLIIKSAGTQVLSHFTILGIALVFYGFYCVLKARLPHRYFGFVGLVLLGYFAIFLITPYGLSWHLDTAANRLLLQVFPLVVYVLGKEAIAIVPISTVPKK